MAFDVGTGKGVLAAVLARRGVHRVVATDNKPRAIACAAESRFLNGLSDHLEPGGEAWLVLSDLAEHLGVRTHGRDHVAVAARSPVVAREIDEYEEKPKTGGTAKTSTEAHAQPPVLSSR